MKATTLFLVLALSSLVLSQNRPPMEPALTPVSDELPVQPEDALKPPQYFLDKIEMN